MSTQCVYRCDICNTEKKETNHWFLGWPSWVQLMGDEKKPQSFSVAPWSDALAPQPNAVHLCGRECVSKYLDKMLTKMGEQK